MRPLLASVSRRGKLLLLFFGGSSSPQQADAPCREMPAPSDARQWPLCYTRSGIAAGRPDPAACGGLPFSGLAFHLRMTGGLLVYPAGTEPFAHTRIIFDLDDGSRLFFDDARKFGSVRALSASEAEKWTFWQGLGPEPLEMGEAEFLSRMRSHRQIKTLLLDQKVIAGIGNIYAAESLFRAGIRPDARGDEISASKLRKLRVSLAEILLLAIRECGSSIRDYRTAHGDAGAFQNTFCVYGRGGQPCTACGTALRSARIGGRSTVWCPVCQKKR
jgi:formamidopyrimidine-DNA glycosylase